jgi:hypothetical protein
MLVKVLQDERIEYWNIFTFLKDIEIASETDQVCLKLCYDVLPKTSRAHADPRAVMTMPTFIIYDFFNVFIVNISQAKCAVLPLAFIWDKLLIFLELFAWYVT